MYYYTYIQIPAISKHIRRPSSSMSMPYIRSERLSHLFYAIDRPSFLLFECFCTQINVNGTILWTRDATCFNHSFYCLWFSDEFLFRRKSIWHFRIVVRHCENSPFFSMLLRTLKSGILDGKKVFKCNQTGSISYEFKFFPVYGSKWVWEREKKKERDRHRRRQQVEKKKNQELNKTTNNLNHFLLIDNASDKTRGYNKCIFILITIERDRACRRQQWTRLVCASSNLCISFGFKSMKKKNKQNGIGQENIETVTNSKAKKKRKKSSSKEIYSNEFFDVLRIIYIDHHYAKKYSEQWRRRRRLSVFQKIPIYYHQ